MTFFVHLRGAIVGMFWDVIYLNSDVGGATPRVWELQWNRTSHSYYWDDGLDPPMGELHLLLILHLTGRVFATGTLVAAVPDTFLSHFHQP